MRPLLDVLRHDERDRTRIRMTESEFTASPALACNAGVRAAFAASKSILGEVTCSTTLSFDLGGFSVDESVCTSIALPADGFSIDARNHGTRQGNRRRATRRLG